MTLLTIPKRRRKRGAAWHWKQTDTWYYTAPGTKRRVALRDDRGRRIRGAQNRHEADLALARIKAAGNWRTDVDENVNAEWIVGRVCSDYVEFTRARLRQEMVNVEYGQGIIRHLNELAAYCGRMPVRELRPGHIQRWIESHESWRSSATQRNVIASVQAAFNHARETHGIANPLKALKKPSAQPRLSSFTADDEQRLYEVTDKPFGDFLFAAIHTGLRPFCELAKLCPADIVETERGMMWRVDSSKAKKRRTIPVRAEVAERVGQLMQTCASPQDAIFRNPQGNPWKKVTGVARFRKIRIALGWDRDPRSSRYTTYTCRHTFAHRMLAGYWNQGQGCSIETLAELMGDTPKVAFDHYGKEWGQQFQDPLWAAIGVQS